jgi:hypothetical protein
MKKTTGRRKLRKPAKSKPRGTYTGIARQDLRTEFQTRYADGERVQDLARALKIAIRTTYLWTEDVNLEAAAHLERKWLEIVKNSRGHAVKCARASGSS